MVQQGGLGRGLASLIPQKNLKKRDNKEIRKTDEDQSYLSSKNKKQWPNSGLGIKNETKNQAPKSKIKKGKRESIERTNEEVSRKEKRTFKEGVDTVAVDRIIPNPHQPRMNFNESKLAELADSISAHGIIQPLIVTSTSSGDYELIAGERRLEASKISGLEKVPVIVRDVDDQKKAEWAVVENVQRHDLNPIEEAKAYKKMQERFSMTQEEIAVRVGKSRSTIANSLRLLNLPIEIQRALMEERISEGHAKTILSISNPEKQRALFELILKENLNVRQAEVKVRDSLGNVSRRKRRHLDPDVYSKQEELSQSLGTKVEIKKGTKGGKIVIDFYSEEELESLLTNLTPQDD